MFTWPIPGYTNITSHFGMRTHPITGVYKLHSGTDVGAPTSVPLCNLYTPVIGWVLIPKCEVIFV